MSDLKFQISDQISGGTPLPLPWLNGHGDACTSASTRSSSDFERCRLESTGNRCNRSSASAGATRQVPAGLLRSSKEHEEGGRGLCGNLGDPAVHGEKSGVVGGRVNKHPRPCGGASAVAWERSIGATVVRRRRICGAASPDRVNAELRTSGTLRRGFARPRKRGTPNAEGQRLSDFRFRISHFRFQDGRALTLGASEIRGGR